MERRTAAEPSPSVRLDDQLCFALYSASLAMNKLYRKLLSELDVTYPQYLVLMILWERDGVSVSDIGERLFLDSATLTPLLKRMERMKHVQRSRSAEDERVVIITLTRSGRNLRRQAKAVADAVLCATELGHEGLGGLRDELRRLRGRLAANA